LVGYQASFVPQNNGKKFMTKNKLKNKITQKNFQKKTKFRHAKNHSKKAKKYHLSALPAHQRLLS